jgi:hypothetical protein
VLRQATFAPLLAALRCLTCSRYGTKLGMLVVPESRWQGPEETAMSSRYARILAAGGAAVLAVTLAPAPALAATTWTIQPGGAITATSGRFTLKDTRTGSVVPCVSATASGTLKRGSGLPGSRAGSLSAVGVTDCTDPVVFHLQATDLPWHVNLSSYDAATGVVTGAVSHLQITMSGDGCTAVIDGTSGTASDGWVKFTYADSTGRLTLLTAIGNLHFWNVSTGCLGLINSGDRATLGGTFTVSPKQAMTSP